MSVRLIDFVKLLFNDYDAIKVFDKEDNLLFIGSKEKIMNLFKTSQIFAVRKVLYFDSANDILILTVE